MKNYNCAFNNVLKFRYVFYLDIMEQVFVISIIITIIFCINKFVEMKYFQQEIKPLKEIVRDILLVFIACLSGGYIYFYFHGYITDFFNVVTETKVLNAASTQIFTDTPGF